jgi:NAD+ kinase
MRNMPTDLPNYTNIALAVHPQNQEAYALAETIASFLETRDKNTSLGTMDDHNFRESISGGSQDLLIALGGDGTMLRAGHISAPSKTPILGINLGSYGFLTEIQRDEWQSALLKVLKGDYWLENRLMLRAVLIRNEEIIGEWNALNDAVISRGETIRPVRLGININTRHLSTIVADAIIASTATGSTAYAMAAGGPILSPELRNILLVPLAPHLSIEQSLVLSEDVVVSISVQTSHQAVISIDGQQSIDLANEDQIKITASDDDVKFIRFQDPGYFYRNLIPYMDQNPVIKKNNV